MENEHTTPRHKQGDKTTEEMNQEELLLYSINYFHESLEKRAEMIAINSRWTNRVIRSGMSGLMLIALSILFLVVIVAKQMNQVADVMVRLDQQMETLVTDIGQMEHYVDAIGGRVSTLPLIVEEISEMEKTVNKLGGHMTEISGRMDHTEVVVGEVISDIEEMDQHLNSVNHIVQGMNHSLKRVGRPFRLFNDMVPMP